MKKTMFFTLIVMAVMMAGFAQNAEAQNYTVREVKGRVEKEAGDTRVQVKSRDTLTADTVIHTGVASSLVISDGSKTFTVQAARSGKVSELISTSSGLRINSRNITQVDTDKADRTTNQVSTASARASDAAEDDDIADE